MISLEACQIYARYNRWQNDRLLHLADSLTDEERKRDRQAPFGSIHGTLNHLLVADRLWLGRFTDKPYPATSLRDELYADWSQFKAGRAATDEAISAWVSSLTEAKLGEKLTFVTLSNPVKRCLPLGFAAMHFFNHQTHHRGQLGVMLEQAGCDIGVTDLLMVPNAPVAQEG